MRRFASIPRSPQKFEVVAISSHRRSDCRLDSDRSPEGGGSRVRPNQRDQTTGHEVREWRTGEGSR